MLSRLGLLPELALRILQLALVVGHALHIALVDGRNDAGPCFSGFPRILLLEWRSVEFRRLRRSHFMRINDIVLGVFERQALAPIPLDREERFVLFLMIVAMIVIVVVIMVVAIEFVFTMTMGMLWFSDRF